MDIIKDKLQNKVFKEEGLKKAIKFINPYLKYKLIKNDSELTNFVTAIFNKAKEDFNDFDFTCIDYKTLRENNNLIKTLIKLELAYAGSCDFDNNIKFNTTAIAFKTLKMGYSADLISIGLISSIYHEIEHAKQNKREILDVQSYRIAKEKYMIDNSKVYSKYYKFFEMEIDANIKGLLEAYKLMVSYNSYYLKHSKYMDFLMKEYIKLRDELDSYKEISRILLRENIDLKDYLEEKGIANPEYLVDLNDLFSCFSSLENEETSDEESESSET